MVVEARVCALGFGTAFVDHLLDGADCTDLLSFERRDEACCDERRTKAESG